MVALANGVPSPPLELNELCAQQGSFNFGPLTISAKPGEVIALIGPNGAGKTTLLRCIVALQRPSAGTINVFGQPVKFRCMPERMAALIEEPRFHRWLSGRDNMRLAAAGRSNHLTRIASCLELVGLHGQEDRLVREYSQGMRQRLGIARLLLSDPQLVILDEASNGLDPAGIFWLRNFILELAGEGRTIVLTSHLLHEVQAVSDTVVLLDGGAVIALGATKKVAGEYATLEELYLSLMSVT